MLGLKRDSRIVGQLETCSGDFCALQFQIPPCCRSRTTTSRSSSTLLRSLLKALSRSRQWNFAECVRDCRYFCFDSLLSPLSSLSCHSLSSLSLFSPSLLLFSLLSSFSVLSLLSLFVTLSLSLSVFSPLKKRILFHQHHYLVF